MPVGGDGLMGSRELSVALLLESDGPGGAEQMILQLATELARRGIEVCPVGPADGCGWLADRFRERGFEPETFRLRSPVDPLCVRDLIRTLRRRRVDVVHSHEFTMAVYGSVAARWLGKRHVVTMHGGGGWEARWRRRAALRWALRRADAIVAVSESMRERLADVLELDAGAIEVIHNGIETVRGRAGPVREELGLSPGDVLLVSVGNLYEVKGHDVLVRALARLERGEAAPPWRAAIAGRGDREGPLRELATSLGIEDRVRFLGYRDDIPDLLAAADVFVLPSRAEGLPLALLEAMIAGKAIVASRTGGIPEAVEAGREALLVLPGDPDALAEALERLVGSPPLRDRLGDAARAAADERASVRTMTDAYERLYRPGGGRPEPGSSLRADRSGLASGRTS